MSAHPNEKLTPWHRLRSVLAPESRDLWVVVIYGVAISLLSLVVPIAGQAVVNAAAFGALLQPLVVLSVIVIALLAVAGVLRALQIGVTEVLQQRLFARMAIDVAHRLPRVRLDVYDQSRGSELVNRFMDVMTIQKTTGLILLDGFTLVLQATLGLALLALYSPVLLGFDIVLLIAMAVVLFVLGRGAVRTSVDESYAKYRVVAWLEELARVPIAFKTAAGAELAVRRADALTNQYVDARKAHFRILLRQIAGSLTIQALASGLLLSLGGWLVAREQLTLGQLVAAELIVTPVVATFAKLGKKLEGFYDLLAAVDKVGALFELPLEQGGSERQRAAGPASLRLRKVHLTHPGRGAPTLSEVELEIEAGARVTLAGPHGSGKSTLLDVIMGFRRPQSGSVELDGIDVREYSLESLRDQVHLVRGRYIFDGTIADNLRAGREELTVAELQEALRVVQLEAEIAGFPDGLQTRLSADQSVLSAGQALRVVWARALLGNPRVLLVDEALDELSPEVRQGVSDQLFRGDRTWTVMVITRLPEIQFRCDRVVRLRDGRVEEGGG